MSAPTKSEGLARLAAKYVWSTPPEIVVSDGLRSLVASVMELGTWEDATDLLAMIGADVFLDVLKAPPAGVLSDKSLAFWHYRLGAEGPPPRSRRRLAAIETGNAKSCCARFATSR